MTVRLYLEPAQLAATPGQPVEVVLVLANDAPADVTCDLRLVGLAPEWVSGLGPVVVPAEDHVRVPIEVALPNGFPSGEHRIGVEVTVDGAPREQLAELELQVESVAGVSVRLSPPTVRGGWRGRFRVNVRNGADEVVTLKLSGRPGGTTTNDDLVFKFKPAEVTLRPGEQTRTKVYVHGRKRPIAGGHKDRALTIVAQGHSVPIHARGTFAQRPVLHRGLLRVMGLLVILSLWAGGLTTAVRFTENRRSAELAQDASSEGAGDDGDGDDGGEDGGEGQPGEGGEDGEEGAPTGATISGVVEGLDDPSGVRVVLRPVSLVESPLEKIALASSVGGKKSFGKFSSQTLQRDPVGPTSGTASTVTDAEGNWAFGGLAAPAYYALTFSKEGFGVRVHVVNVTEEGAALTLPVTLAAGDGRLAGTVTGPDGPLGGASITVTDGTLVFETTTPTEGDVGTWSIDGLSTPGTYLVTAERRGFGTQTVQVALGASESRSGVDVEMAEGVGTITGTVRGGADGLGDVMITATNGDITRSVTTLTDDPVGAYTIPNLPIPGTYTLTFESPGWLPQTMQVELDGNAPDTDVELVSVTGSLSGVVTDQDGVELQAVGVTVLKDDAPLLKALTADDPEGTYELAALLPGTYVLSFDLFGYTSQSTTVTIASGDRQQVDIELAEITDEPVGTAVIRGIVRSATTGDEIPNVTVEGGGQSATTDSSGSFVLDELDAGTIDLEFSHASHQSNTRTVQVADASDTTIDQSMLPLGGVQGQVTTLTATPIDGVTVTVDEAPDTDTDPITALTTTTDSNGEYEILQKLPTGTYVATFTHADFGERSREFEASAGSVSVNDITLVELGTISGIVQEPAAFGGGLVPVASASVTITRTDVTPEEVVFGPETVTTSFTVSGLQPGDYRIDATDGDIDSSRNVADLELREVRDGSVVLTPEESTISGIVYYQSGGAQVGVTATLNTSAITGYTPLSVFPFVSPIVDDITVNSTSTGYYTISGPVAGSVNTIEVTADGFFTRVVAISAPTQGTSGNILMTAEPRTLGGSATLQAFGGGAASETVTAELSSSLLAAPITDTFTADDDSSNNTDTDYEFTDLQPGTYTVTLSAPGYHSTSFTQVISGDPNVATPVGAGTLLEESSISVEVHDNVLGTPLSGATVTLTKDGSPNFEETATSAADGTVTFEELEAGDYTVTAAKSGFESESEDVDDLEVGEDRTGVDVVALQLPDLSVVVSSSSGSAITSASVTAAPAAGGAVISLPGTASGMSYVASATNLDPGEYTISISASLHEAKTATTTLSLGSNTTVNQTLNRFTDVSVVVLDPNGDGLDDASVSLVPEAGGTILSLSHAGSGSVATGTYSAFSVPSGEYRFRVSHPSYAPQTYPEEDDDPLEVEAGVSFDTATVNLTTAGSIVINVTSDGVTTIDDVKVEMRIPADSTFATRTRYTGDDGAGSVTFGGLGGATYELRLSKPGYVGTTFLIQLDSGDSETENVELEVYGQQAVTVYGDPDDVNDPAGRIALNNAVVIANPDDGGPAVLVPWTSVSNLYFASSLEPGDYEFSVTAPFHDLATANVTIASGSNSAIELVLPRWPTVTVTATADPDGTLSGATVTATPDDGGSILNLGETSTAGTYQASLVPPGDYTLTLSKPGYTSTTASITVEAGTSATQAMEVERQASLTITAYLNSTSGGTLDGVTAVLYDLDDDDVAPVSLVSGTNGVVSFLGLTDHEYRVDLTRPGAVATSVTDTLTVGEAATADAVLLDHPDITIAVEDQAGAIATGASVVATPSGGGSPVTFTDANDDGVYVAPDLEPGDYDIVATKAGHEPDDTTYEVVAGTSPVGVVATLTLQDHPDLEVDVELSTGGIATGASVIATPSGGGVSVTLTDDDDDGTYVAADVAPGTYDIVASKAEHESDSDSFTVSAGAGPVGPAAALELVPWATVTVVVEGDLSGDAIGGASVVLTSQSGGGSFVLQPGVTGTYSAVVAPGTYSLLVTGDGFGDYTDTNIVVATTNLSMPVEVDQFPTITVTVTGDLSGDAVGGAVVTLTSETGGGSFVLQPGVTGTYSAVVEPDTYALSVVAAGFETHTDDDIEVTVDDTIAVELVEHPTLSVDVVSRFDGVDVALEGATVTATPSGGGSTITLGDGDGDGTYEAFRVAPDTYELSASAPGHTATSDQVTASAGAVATASLVLLEHPDLVVDVEGFNDAAVGDATVMAVPDEGGAALHVPVTDAGNGLYGLSGITPGSYTLVVSRTGFETSATVTFTASPGTELATQMVQLDAYGTVDVLVEEADGTTPIADALVQLTVDGDTSVPLRQTTTDASGVARFTDLPPNVVYAATAYAGGFETATGLLAAALDPGDTATINLLLDAETTLTVDVTSDPSGDELTSASVWATENGGDIVPLLHIGGGRYRAEAVPAGDWAVSATAPDHAPGTTATFEIEVGDAATADLSLSAYATLTVDVLGAIQLGGTATMPLTTATVTASDGVDTVTFVHQGGGTFVAEISKTATFDITVSAPGFDDTTVDDIAITLGVDDVVDAGIATLDAVNGGIVGDIRDAFGNLVTDSVTVTAVAAGMTATRTEDTVTATGDYVLNSLPPGTWNITFETADLAPLTRTVTIPLGSDPGVGATVTLDVILVPTGGAVLGAVYSQASDQVATGPDNPAFPIGGVAVTLYEDGTLDVVDSVTTSLSSGSYAFVGLEPGSYDIAFVEDDHTTATADITVDPGGITTWSPVLIQTPGTLVVDTEDSADVALNGVGIRITSHLLAPGFVATTTSGAGQATFTDLPPGVYDIEVTSTPAGYSLDDDDPIVATVVPGGTATEFLTFEQGGSLTGLILTDTGASTAPAAGVLIEVSHANGFSATTTTGSDGTFSLALPVGTGYTATASLAGFGSMSETGIDIAAGGGASFDQTLSAFASLLVRVGEDATSSIDIEGATVVLLLGGSEVATQTTDVDGEVLFTDLVPGALDYTVEVSENDHITEVADVPGLDAGVTASIEVLLVES